MNRFGVVMLMVAVTVVATACSGSSEKPSSETQIETVQGLEQQVDELISKDQYDQALAFIDENADVASSGKVSTLREKAHLNYGLFLEYRGGNREMRDRMTNALRQYIEVLKINRQNQKALSEIDQIMGIYDTMPGKTVPDDIKRGLKDLGLNY